MKGILSLQYVQSVVDWFKSLSTLLKIVILLAGLLIVLHSSLAIIAFRASNSASNILFALSSVVFVVALVGLIVQAVRVQAVRRRPSRQWAIAAGITLAAIFVHGVVSGALNLGF